MLNLICFLTCVLAFITTSQSVRGNVTDGDAFLENIIHYYGENNSITTTNLEDLLLLISARRSDLISKENPLEEQKVQTYSISYILQFLLFKVIDH